MKKLPLMLTALSLLAGSCLPAQPASGEPTSTPISVEDLQATAAVFVQQTLQAFPSDTPEPTATPVVVTPTATPLAETPTETPLADLPTGTATLAAGTGLPEATHSLTGTAEAVIGGTPTAGLVFVSTPTAGTPTQTPRPLFHGTLPPNLPSGSITIVNRAKVEVYISLRCETAGGYVTYLEYPVKSTVEATAPAGNYTYVAWVGGRQFSGAFRLSQGRSILIDIFKSKVEIK